MIATISPSGQMPRVDFLFATEDEGLRLAAVKLLQSSSYGPLRRLRCDVKETVLILSGVVPSYYHKQLAQAHVQRLDGIQSIRNFVEVRAS